MQKQDSIKPRRVLAFSLIAVFVVCAALAVLGISARSGVDPADARDGIVWVVSLLYGSDGTLASAATGTGWAVGVPGQPVEYFVTNAHVVKNAYVTAREQGGAGNVDIYFSAAENDRVSAQVVFYSAPDEKDIAVLRLPSPTTKRTALALRPSDTVKVGTTAFALGYPSISSEMQGYTTFDQSDITVTRGVVSKRTNVAWGTYEVFQMDVSIAAGNSGGPLVDERGFVLGVNTSGVTTTINDSAVVDVGMNYASIINELIRILDAEKLPYTCLGAKDWMIYVFTPLSVIALLAALWLLLGKQAKAEGARAGSAGAAAVSGEAGRNGGAAKRAPVLRGVNGAYAGERFTLERKLTMGSDAAQCSIVYPAGTPGISSNHCSVAYDAATDCFVLTDNGSSFGTFIDGGRKLPAHVPQKLASGDMFYLASPDNRFVVTKE